MRTKKLLLAIILFLGGTTALYAAPSNGSRLPPQGRVEIGYEYNAMFDRQLRYSYGRVSTQDHFFDLSVGLFDWLSLDGKIGLGDIIHKNDPHLPKIEYNTGFAGGYGLRIKVLDQPKSGLLLILGGQHISVHPENKNIENSKYESFLDDWQLTSLAAKRFKYATPYIGIKGSDCEMVYKTNEENKRRRYSRNHIGFICGADFFLFNKTTRINVEARFFDETAFSTAITCLL